MIVECVCEHQWGSEGWAGGTSWNQPRPSFSACAFLLNLFVHREILYKFIPIQHQKHLLFGSMVLFDCLEYCESSVRCSMMSQCCLIVSHCDKLFRDVPQIKLALGFPLSPFPQSSIFPTVVSQLLSDFWA